ncbi:MAG TPA: hypothetical protein VG407_18920 [Caulobacteraceae bacterium]|jgi:hypothetical protein|nr:hypothetical protein [Caulobacteraceae bacterium]
MWRPSLVALFVITVASAALAGDLGRVTKFLRPSVHTFDAAGQPTGTLNASDVRLPAAIVGLGKGKSIGISVKGKTVYLRGLDVQTEGLQTKCEPVQTASRGSGSAYAGSNMGIGSAADCGGH